MKIIQEKAQNEVIGIPAARQSRLSPYASAAIVTQLLAIYDKHPQWRTNRRENGVIASHAYEEVLTITSRHCEEARSADETIQLFKI